MIEVRPVGDDWELLRRLRLEALLDAPEAFSSWYEREVDMDEASWRRRAENMAIAFRDGAPAGIVGGIPDGDVHVMVAMWVDPAHRRVGVATALVDWIVGRARAMGKAAVRTAFATGNDRACRVYERYGFVVTGEVTVTETDPNKSEHHMRLAL